MSDLIPEHPLLAIGSAIAAIGIFAVAGILTIMSGNYDMTLKLPPEEQARQTLAEQNAATAALSAIFDILEALKPHFPDIAGGFARGTGGVDLPFILSVLAGEKNGQEAAWLPMHRALYEKWVLVACELHGEQTVVEAMQYRRDGWMTFGCNGGHKISPTAWMHKPEPPTGEGGK
ncbi:hypothetical protein FPZ24_08040 [Sphingomonas panacisoli]|uniref:Uncharacterized protein n=1 Tax=Sphingomonas panacisoli TaxID=1813879 RepID=A0A5B8LH71_9SPHN|nr:hypothetical protein [Sphingomonas panacisoli]QDZ07433.1 hypothetical protein FPZ24_08040 [Sphingomonas panacisoli]